MPLTKTLTQESSDAVSDLIVLTILAIVVGIAAGGVCSAFRFALDWVHTLHRLVIVEIPGPAGLALLVVGGAVATAIAAGLVYRIAPAATGSGIPHVEAVLAGDLRPAPPPLIPIKFVGGTLAIGAGLALGREGPSVQMGASTGTLIGRLFRRNWRDRRALVTAGAGAGLATAFNSPGAGAIFVLEELVGKFEPRIAMVALGASVGAIFVSRTLLGNAPVFTVAEFSAGGVAAQPLFLTFGMLSGLLAVIYNRSLLATLNLAERIGGPIELRAAVIGGVIGLLAWFAPDLVGGGDDITQHALDGDLPLGLLPAIFLFRLALGTVSYAAATPGGLFAPMLVLGAVSGLAFGIITEHLFPGLGLQPEAFALVGMGAFFAGVVRAPLTGIILVTEMTASSGLLVPLLSSCFGAMFVTEALRDPPIYASLKKRAALSER
ncbi:MAG: H(+)/Cl(-) exchange transporter ClcA [Gammaproteobacteria bacterium]|nr:H(+)/Cl(-) exchange transporter ClcA [Gammaproteobacteria bacterium]MCP5424024.1 H(+)/Cl(-) exchange transporter ClcA [Gammaproteobacteria bacterium]MCP5459542.1 H(+)/Cl(-) exchange transporter ClcA [Gammaproteobacteria bacterium]